MTQVWAAVIAGIVSPIILFGLQLIKERRAEKRDGIKDAIRDMRMVTLRLELLFNLSHNPDDKATILNLYDKYHKAGGNSYITKRIEEWSSNKKKKAKK